MKLRERLDLNSVLVADDSATDRSILEKVISDAGFTCYTASNGEEALAIAREKLPAVILLDILMPELQGFEVCKKLMTSPRTANISVIFISIKSMIEDKLRGLKLGAVDYICKPFFKREIIARVKTHMRLQSIRDQFLESENKYLALVESVSDGILLWSGKNGVNFVNKAFLKMTGYHEKEVLGIDLASLIHPHDCDATLQTLEPYLSCPHHQHCAMELNFRLLHKNGSAINVSCSPCGIDIGDSRMCLCTLRDMTEKLNLERQLIQAQKMEAVGTMASSIAHDFNNLLALINGYTELTLNELPHDSPLLEKLQIVHDAGRSAVVLTKGLLSFSRKTTMEPELIDLKNEIERAYSFLERGISKRIKLKIVTPAEPVMVMADKNQIVQMIVNLCVNARDAMAIGGVIHVSLDVVDAKRLPKPVIIEPASSHAQFAKITIKDNGSGIPEEIINNIFDPFFTTKPIGKGSGLGLAIVNRIVQNHNGWIDVKSALGKGTSFFIYLPVSGEKGEELTPASVYKHKFHPELNKVLVVDDDPLQVEMIKHFLRENGYDVLTAFCGSDALELTETQADDINLFIIDYLMPEMPGTEVCERILSRWPSKRIILISGAAQIPVTGNFLLRKPFTMNELLLALDKTLEDGVKKRR